MEFLDWLVLSAFGLLVLWDGLRLGMKQHRATDWLVAGRSASAVTMGLSIMATQASAITLVGTTGKGFFHGTDFVQLYYALPLAMLLLAFTAVPFFHRLRAVTAYDWLERRFGRRTRKLVAATFLVQRALALGFVLSAPSVVLSALFDLPYSVVVVALGGFALLYTAVGGVAAVLVTDVKQMLLMTGGLVALFVVAREHLPEAVGFGEVWRLGAATGRLELWDTRFDPADGYNVWSSLFGATFLFLAYFGTDQSQVQRYLSGRSLAAKRGALALNATLKIPFQFAILFLGLVLAAWGTFEPTPLVFHEETARAAAAAVPDWAEHEARHAAAQARAAEAWEAAARAGEAPPVEAFEAVDAGRAEALARARAAGVVEGSDANHVVPWFLEHRLPAGLVGVLLAAILAAALSSVDSELSALGSVATVDLAGRDAEDQATARGTIWLARGLTLLLGSLATVFALSLERTGPLIERINAVGSLFYGALLAVFALALLVPRAGGVAATGALLAAFLSVAGLVLATGGELAFLWRNTLGLGIGLLVGFLLSLRFPKEHAA